MHGVPLTQRDIKRQQMKMTQAKQEAKDTKTKKMYHSLMKEVAKERKRIIKENAKIDIADKPDFQGVRNLFKMARIEVGKQKLISKHLSFKEPKSWDSLTETKKEEGSKTKD